MVWCRSMPFVAAPDARVLILGSMPGARSLQAEQYYAHPQNHFWPLIFAILAEPLPTGYQDRVKGLLTHGIALGDVIASCNREGSSDAAITEVTVNDFTQFFEIHQSIKLLAFNGSKAAQIWHLQVKIEYVDRQLITLPSTSPANTRPLAEKIQSWSVIKEYLL